MIDKIGKPSARGTKKKREKDVTIRNETLHWDQHYSSHGIKDYYAQLHAYKFDNLDELDQFLEDIICGFSAALCVSVMSSVWISSDDSFPSLGLRKFYYFFFSGIASILFSLLFFWNFYQFHVGPLALV